MRVEIEGNGGMIAVNPSTGNAGDPPRMLRVLMLALAISTVAAPASQAEQAAWTATALGPPTVCGAKALARFSFVVDMETAHKLKAYPPMEILRLAQFINTGADY